MIPIRDENPTRRVPWVTLAIIGINAAVFAYELTLSPAALDALWLQWGFVPARFAADPFAPAQVITVVTAMFLHAGWLHVGSNLLYLWIFGITWAPVGPVGFTLFYLVCGAAAALVQMLAAPTATLPMIGASGLLRACSGRTSSSSPAHRSSPSYRCSSSSR